MDITFFPVLREAQCLIHKTHILLYDHLLDIFKKKKCIGYACVNCWICLNNSTYKTLTNSHWAEDESLMGCSTMSTDQ